MRSISAYTSKLKAEVQGRTYKIQNTAHSLTAQNSYRGAAGCSTQSYSPIRYSRKYSTCCYNTIKEPIEIIKKILDGGSPSNSGPKVLDGLYVLSSDTKLLVGGSPTNSGTKILIGSSGTNLQSPILQGLDGGIP